MVKLLYDDNLDPSENVTIIRQHCPGGSRWHTPHTHEFIEIVYCYEGVGVQVVDKTEYSMGKGSVFFLNYGQEHRFRSDYGMQYFDILLTPSFLSESLANTSDALALLALAAFTDFHIIDPLPAVRLTGKDMLETEDIIIRMENEFKSKDTGYRTVIYGYMMAFLAKIFRKMASLEKPGDLMTDRRITPDVISYIEEHLNEKITLSELADKAFYSPSYFGRLFKDFTGQSLTGFIHYKRVERATDLLKATELPAEQVGRIVGYSDKKQFYRYFRQYSGTTPGALRSSRKSG